MVVEVVIGAEMTSMWNHVVKIMDAMNTKIPLRIASTEKTTEIEAITSHITTITGK